MSADTNLRFTTDIAGVTRPQGAGWDIGASEAVPAASAATEMLALTLTPATASFSTTATFNGDTGANNSATIYYCDSLVQASDTDGVSGAGMYGTVRPL